MNAQLLALYHSFPAPIRSLAASLRGYELRRWRYGRETERLVEEAAEREAWSAHQWIEYQEVELAKLLERAATRVPYYRELWQARRRRGDYAAWDVLANWPVLEKHQVRASPEAFLAEDCNRRMMFAESTSGTTGTPLRLWWSRSTVRRWYALYEARIRRWHGLSRHDRWAILGGQLIIPQGQVGPPFWVWNAGLRQLYLSAYHISPHTAPAYLETIRRAKVRYLLGYPSGLSALASAAHLGGDGFPNLAVVFANAEKLSPKQRALIESGFRCPVRDTYGMAEIVAGASECQHGRLHLWPEVGIIQQSPSSGEDLVCTGLLNHDMPLIRYRTGDVATVTSEASDCPCARKLPEMLSIEGRVDDVLYTADGRSIGRLDPVFKGDLRIVEAQVVQEALDRVRVKYVPAAGHGPSDEAAIVAGIQARLGAIDVIMEPVPCVPRGANGKLRAVVCALPESQRATVGDRQLNLEG